MRTYVIGTRGSRLALAQVELVASALRDAHPAVSLEVREIRTEGDVNAAPLSLIGGLGVFTKAIEDALLHGECDIAVHSLKDLPADLPPGLVLAAVPPREDPRDALVTRDGVPLASLPAGARIGTGSGRRAVLLRMMRADVRTVEIRGNVDTRIRKLDAGECDAIVLACAGLKRLGLHGRISLALPVEVSIPAPGQGIVAIEVRADRPDVASAIETIGDAEAMDALTAERAIVSALGGGCQMPLGAYARIDAAELQVEAVVIAPDASRVIRESGSGPRTDAAELGMRIADALLQQGAGAILSNGA